MSDLLYEFETNGIPYIFDGESLAIFEKNNYNKDLSIKLQNSINKYKKNYCSNVAFILNNDCNLSCSYCYANKGKFDIQGIVINLEFVKKTIDSLFEICRNNKGDRLHITFFGGEPLLQFNLIKEIVTYTKGKTDNNIQLLWDIVTNGTIFNDEIIDFFVENNFKLVISIDGTKDIHDFSRKFIDGTGSYDIIESNLKKYIDKIHICCRITVNDNNTNIYDAVNHLKTIGITDIIFGLDCNITQEAYNKFVKSVNLLLKDYIHEIKEGKYYILRNVTQKLSNIIPRQRLRSHCNAGVAYFAISADEKLYVCPRFVGINEGELGILDNNTTEKIESASMQFKKKLYTHVGERIESCNKCSFKYLCGGICYHHSYTVNHKIISKTPKDCSLKKIMIKTALELITSLSLEERRNFLLYLSGNYKVQ